ncbi:MAG: hypothetical protein A3C50_03135 [Candidatus Staskawiczbacteria bacterium RIFCSPHIGHO2_02_FULL_43_16]|uniref:Uncharacterized protein n=1 Tax=Candidatus Staskawiczbacteria bacterium RIFCSPHIGHO2_01_FULL_41_41 TaxID=1802203 RepID=A0A1G2HUU1_9BACT|nr:MAG: hypothetical protein A2822_03005 [Candidatus Staskawiczbacteria bacterium RIFCSPHIGHO2_01_FULL_41_41]OGZ68697.1 MAG: hypothetical protein A3C50_03135 [Candidatus Staskawiczbacteria bacterium RIFCSPHIGHO2_02_FULL_43_16]OGZ75159.1 MAG: hypothetical protein A3A12_01060 [Candidatus Staskawiczbacteria bacterium RIFCSPLOWO2_01_FULL_43_17b]
MVDFSTVRSLLDERKVTRAVYEDMLDQAEHGLKEGFPADHAIRSVWMLRSIATGIRITTIHFRENLFVHIAEELERLSQAAYDEIYMPKFSEENGLRAS